MAKKVEIFRDKDKDLRVRVVAANGKKELVTEGLENKTYAKKFANDLADALGVKVKDSTKKP